MTFPKKIGVTGGIGSGKSVVAAILRTMGYPVYDSDRQAKFLMNQHPEIRRQLIAFFGKEVYLNNELNRSFLAERIFANPENRETVNNIVHPVVRADFTSWCSGQNAALVFQESALLFETGGYRLLDANVLVVAPKELRIQRVMQRDQATREQVLARMSAQLPEKEKRKLADYCLKNDEQELLIPQVIKLINDLITQSAHVN